MCVCVRACVDLCVFALMGGWVEGKKRNNLEVHNYISPNEDS